MGFYEKEINFEKNKLKLTCILNSYHIQCSKNLVEALAYQTH
jgi:hypothetical protein